MKEIKNDLGNSGETHNYCDYVSSSGEQNLINYNHEFINTYIKNSILISVEINRSNCINGSDLNEITYSFIC